MSGEVESELNLGGYRGRGAVLLSATLATILSVTPAGAQTVWTAPEGQSYAMLPEPEPGTPVTGGVLLCNAQVWTLSLAMEPGATLQGVGGHATLTARSLPFSVESAGTSAGVDLNIPYVALEPMKAGTRLQIEFEGEPPVRFPLTGSRRAITTVEGACPPRQLPTENLIELIAGSQHLELGRQLRSDDIKDFVISTNDLPDLRVAMVELEQNRQLFFVEICGSSWYYGVSGCNLSGFTQLAVGSPETDPDRPYLEGWQQVFESEGAHMYTVPDQVIDGWPNLIAVPLKPGFPDKLWTWTGQRYSVEGTIQAELRTGQ